MEMYIAAGIAAIELVIILFLLFKKKTRIIKQVSSDFKNEIHDMKQKVTALKLQADKSTKKNQFLEEKITLLEGKIFDMELINLELIKKKEELSAEKYKLEALQRRKNDLFAMAIHDIKNPMSAIKSYLELLESYDLSLQLQQEIIQSMMESSEQIFRLTNEITQIVSKEEIEFSLNLQEASLKDIIDSVCAQNAGYAKSKKIKLTNRSSINIPRVLIDVDKMKEVIDNLVNNAIKYGPEGTNVHIITYFTSKTLTVEVSDDGVGLNEEDQKKAFMKGEKLTPRPTGNESSTGLGLWIVKLIIEEHNGKVFVVSKLGSGSAFGFELPVRPS